MKVFKKLALVSLIFAVVLIVAGITLGGGQDVRKNIDFHSVVDIVSFGTGYDNNITYPTQDVNTIQVDLSACDISLHLSTNDTVEVKSYNMSDTFQTTVENQTMIIQEEDFDAFGKARDRKVDIYIPQTMTLDTIGFDVDACDIESETLMCQQLIINSNASDFDFNALEAVQVIVKVNASDISIERLDCTSMNVEGNASDLDIGLVHGEHEYAYNVSGTVIDVTVNDRDWSYYNHEGTRTMIIHGNMMDVEIENEGMDD